MYFLRMVFLCSVLALVASCTREVSDKSTLTIQFPNSEDGNSSSSQKTEKLQISQNVSALATSDSKWGLPSPTSFSQINCFAIAVRTPEVPAAIKCTSLYGATQETDYFVGLFTRNSKTEIEVPSGEKRIIQLVGFVAADPSYCVDLGASGGTLNLSKFSPPVLLATTEKDLSPGDVEIPFQITSNLAGAEVFEECDTKPLGNSSFVEATALGGLPGGSTSATTFTNIPIKGFNADKYAYEIVSNGNCAASVYNVAFTSFGVSNTTSITLSTGSLADGNISLCIVGKNDSGQTQTYPNIFTWTKDTAIPSTLALSVSPYSVATPTLTVRNAEVGTTVNLYKTTSASPSEDCSTTVFQSFTAASTTTVVTLASALTENDYTFTAQSVDAASNKSACSNAVTTTVDTAAPTAITTLSQAGTGTGGTGIYDNLSPIFSWTPVTDSRSGLSHYQVGIGNAADASDVTTWINIGQATTYTSAPTIPFTFDINYYFSVRAVDAAGNATSTVTKSWTPLSPALVKWKQQAYLKSDQIRASSLYGYAVSIDGNWMVVGAPRESSGATGVSGTVSSDIAATDSGAAFVYKRDAAGQWKLDAYLKPDNTYPGQHFGYSVAISGNTIIIGAPDETSPAAGVSGTGATNFSGSPYGAAYTFKHNGTHWVKENYIKPIGPYSGARFGTSVAIFRDTLVVGAPGFGTPANAGAAYVFTRSTGNWTQRTALSEGIGDNNFGTRVAIYDTTIGIASVTSVNTATVSVYEGSGASWTKTDTLTALMPESTDLFGSSVSIYKDRIAVGAPGERGATLGVPTTGISFVAGTIRGAAFVYKKSGSAWPLSTYVKPTSSSTAQLFGKSVSLFENTLVVGAPGYSNDDGMVYTYKIDSSNFYHPKTYTPGNPNIKNSFGDSVSISNSAIVIGGQFESSGSSPGVQNIEIYNSASTGATSSGAAWLFESY
jgi:hypothetical protein